MDTFMFSIKIAAPREKVWQVMLDPKTYQKWTSEFMEGSYYEGSWEKGKEIRFLGSGDGGMRAIIAENKPHEFLSIKHIAVIEANSNAAENQESPSSDWDYENYTLLQSNGGTELIVEVDGDAEYEEWLHETWPKALLKLKQLCEKHVHGDNGSNLGGLNKDLVIY